MTESQHSHIPTGIDWGVSQIDTHSSAVILVGSDKENRTVMGYIPGRFQDERGDTAWFVRLPAGDDALFVNALQRHYQSLGVSIEEMLEGTSHDD